MEIAEDLNRKHHYYYQILGTVGILASILEVWTFIDQLKFTVP